MSYLNLAKGIPDFSKAVISLWFRAPQDSIDNARNAAQSNILSNTIPLLTFGDGPTVIDWEPNSVDVVNPMNYTHPGPSVISVTAWVDSGPLPLQPCYIGLNCAEPDRPALEFHFMTAEHTTISNMSLTRMEMYSLGTDPPPEVGDPNVPGSGWNSFVIGFPDPGAGLYVGQAVDFANLPEPSTGRPEYFYVRTRHVIEADQWHHLLLSFDFSPGCNTHQRADIDPVESIADVTSSFCKLWYAIDDVNYDGPDNLGPFIVEGSSDKNGILSANAHAIANSFNRLIYNTAFAAAVCQFDSVSLPTSNHELGVPASAKYVDKIHHVEMAELQLFTGMTLDTDVETNRRAFVDYERDKDGHIIKDNENKATLKPIAPKKTEELLSKKPEILLHGSSKWINGKNTGTAGMDYGADPPEIKPEGQFDPTGKIKKYKPDPSLQKTPGT